MLGTVKTLDGDSLDIALTTNSALLTKKAQALANAGLQRISVSLDALDDGTFKRMNDVDFPVSDVLRGIEVAHRVGFHPIKVNMVVKAGINDHQIVPMARYFKGTPVILRFIEYMDVGSTNGWEMGHVVPSNEVLRRLAAEVPLQEVARDDRSETASRWRYADGSGEIGTIKCHEVVLP